MPGVEPPASFSSSAKLFREASEEDWHEACLLRGMHSGSQWTSRRLAGVSRDFVNRYDVPAPRYTSYPTVPAWDTGFGADAYGEALDKARTTGEPLSVYVHIPFCKEMCTYCGCNVVVSRKSGRANRYLKYLAREVSLVASRLGGRRDVSRLHLGGGTPTFLNVKQLELLWERLTRDFHITDSAELALEIDPAVTDREQLELLASFGFSRLSMGVQDFDPTVQRAVHRIQTVDETRAALESARELGFRSVNFDLIYGLPHQTADSWRRTLDTVAELRPDRVAAFSFAYVPTVRPNQRRLPVAALPRGASKLDLFGLTHDVLTDAGYEAIGMDHFALPDDELALARRERRLWRDFQGYTVWRGADTIAFGATGIASIGGAYAQNQRSLERYYQAIEKGRFPTEKGLWLTDEDRRRRDIITQIMCNFWVDLGPSATKEFSDELAALEPLERDGLVERSGTEISVTSLGRLFVRNVAAVFDAYLKAPVQGPIFSQSV